jgi:hypothetical protein
VKTFVGEEEQGQEEEKEEEKEPSLPQGEVAVVVDKDKEEPSVDTVNPPESAPPQEQVPDTVKTEEPAEKKKEVILPPVHVEVAAPKAAGGGKGKKKKKKKNVTGQPVVGASTTANQKVEDPSPAYAPTSTMTSDSKDDIKSKSGEDGVSLSSVETLNDRIKELEQIVAQREEQLERQALEMAEARETAASLKKQQEEISSLSAKEERYGIIFVILHDLCIAISFIHVCTYVVCMLPSFRRLRKKFRN